MRGWPSGDGTLPTSGHSSKVRVLHLVRSEKGERMQASIREVINALASEAEVFQEVNGEALEELSRRFPKGLQSGEMLNIPLNYGEPDVASASITNPDMDELAEICEGLGYDDPSDLEIPGGFLIFEGEEVTSLYKL